MGVVAAAVSDTGDALRTVFTNPGLRRLNLAFGGSLIGDWAYATAIAVWAYGIGGAKLVAVWAVIRLLLMAVVTPFTATLADRNDRKMILVGSDLVRLVLIVSAAIGIWADATILVFVLAASASVVGTPFRPAMRALMPSLVTRPEELTAANGTSSTLESLSFFVGPAIAGLLLATTSVPVVLLFDAATFAWSALLISGVRSSQPGRVPTTSDDEDEDEEAGFLRDMVEGFTYMLRNADLRLVLVLTCAQTVVAGALAVFVVSIAFDLVDLGAQGVGYLDSALGLGALLGGFIAISRASANRLGGDFAVGVILWSLPLVLVAVWPTAAVALLVMAILGLANPLVDVNLDTMLQRLTPDRLLARVFGTIESAFIAFMAVGAGVMPLLMELFGIRWALAGLGVAVTLTVVPALPRLHRLDLTLRAPSGFPLLQAIPMFAPLASPLLETLARQLTTHQVSAGSPVFLEGDVGDAFYVIESGEVRIGHGATMLRTEVAGDYFGEIALLRDVPRTADAVAVVDTVLRRLDRTAFLDAITGDTDAVNAAESVVSRRLLAG
jgi:MFS family permease